MCKYVDELAGQAGTLYYSADLRTNMVQTLREWLRFQKDPAAYASGAHEEYPKWTVGQARRQLVDPSFEQAKKHSSVLSSSAAAIVVERDLLFYQHAFVTVTANLQVLSPEDARVHPRTSPGQLVPVMSFDSTAVLPRN